MRLAMLSLTLAAAAWAQTAYQGIATSKQIMAQIQKPAMDGLAASMQAGGPKDDKEWAIAGQQAAVLAETAQLLLMGTRPLDQDVWIKASNRLREAAAAAVKAAESKDVTVWKTSVMPIRGACKSCHDVHKKKQQ
ncbi:MAG: cytochrome c [Bryobacteraceae bacterium]